MRMGETGQINANLRLKNERLTVSVVPTYSSLHLILLLFMRNLYLCLYSVKRGRCNGF